MDCRGRVVLSSLITLAVLTTVLAVTSGTAQAAPRGCGMRGNYEICLTDPAQFDSGRDRAIINRLRGLVQATQGGDRIRIAMFTWTLNGIADDLAAAAGRGVDVRVVLDDKETNFKDGNNNPYDVLRRAGIPVRVCNGSCVGGTSHGSNIQHNKFFLFDTAADRSVVQSSANLTASQLGKPNNLIRVTGDPRLYDFFLGYWNRLNVGSWTYGGVRWTDDDKNRLGTLPTKGYVYPRTSFDNVLAILRNITACSADGDGDGDGDKKIWVTASLFTRPREAIRDRLAELEDQLGCNVKVLVPDIDTERWVQSATSRGYNLGNNKVRRVDLHHKVIIVDAYYNGRWQETVFTGSHNFTGTSLRQNDEALLRVEDPFVFSRYRQHYDGLFVRAANA